jgi:hypothetical protein
LGHGQAAIVSQDLYQYAANLKTCNYGAVSISAAQKSRTMLTFSQS